MTLDRIYSVTKMYVSSSGVAYGRGVYFARDVQYSLGYAGRGGGTRYMYLARVLVGQYCAGNSGMIVPPAKNASRPEIFSNQWLITLRNHPPLLYFTIISVILDIS